jgi:hypothetical protein
MPFREKLETVVLVTLILAVGSWQILRIVHKRSKVPPPTPRELALRALERLRPDVKTLNPYSFSIAVSDVLRHFIDQQFGLRAEHQTSAEFLAAIQSATEFSEDDRRLLANFLEQCDMIKFARAEANETTNEALFASAHGFVQGGRL